MAARARAVQAEAEPAPRSDAYTGMLAVSLLALIVGCVLLYLDFSDYDTMGKPPPVPTDSSRAAIPGAAPGGFPGGVVPGAPAPAAPGAAVPAVPAPAPGADVPK
jgi:hypothetical protein